VRGEGRSGGLCGGEYRRRRKRKERERKMEREI